MSDDDAARNARRGRPDQLHVAPGNQHSPGKSGEAPGRDAGCLLELSRDWLGGNFYKQYEGTITLYNEKFAKPAKSIMDKLYAANELTRTPFDEQIEWIYYELWHHAGRRARMGTSMIGPDYTQSHAFFEVAQIFYMKSIPEAEKLMPGVTTGVMNSDYHTWTKGFTKEQFQQQIDFYEQRYQQWLARMC